MFCKNCGESLDGSTKFCPKCGTAIESTSATAPKIQEHDNRFRCPKCGSRKLTVITDRDWSGAITSGAITSVAIGKTTGALMGASHLKQQTSFICSDCGNRFRNPEELRQELNVIKRKMNPIHILSIIMLVLSLFMAVLCFVGLIATGDSELTIMLVLFLLLALTFAILSWFSKRKVSGMTAELQSIENGMRNFQ